MNVFTIVEVSNGWTVSKNRDFARGEMRLPENEFVFTDARKLGEFLMKVKARTKLAERAKQPVRV